jgi:uncharacterized protein YwgA
MTKTYIRVANVIKLLYTNNKPISIRIIARLMNKENCLRCIHKAIDKLIKNWNIYRQPIGTIVYLKDFEESKPEVKEQKSKQEYNKDYYSQKMRESRKRKTILKLNKLRNESKTLYTVG